MILISRGKLPRPKRSPTGNLDRIFIVKSLKYPSRLWLIIAKILGIKLKPNEKPIISSVLHVLTFGSAAALFCTNLAYEIQDVISNNTKSDILDGFVSVMVFGYFCGLGRSLERIFVVFILILCRRLLSSTGVQALRSSQSNS